MGFDQGSNPHIISSLFVDGGAVRRERQGSRRYQRTVTRFGRICRTSR